MPVSPLSERESHNARCRVLTSVKPQDFAVQKWERKSDTQDVAYRGGRSGISCVSKIAKGDLRPTKSFESRILRKKGGEGEGTASGHRVIGSSGEVKDKSQPQGPSANIWPQDGQLGAIA